MGQARVMERELLEKIMVLSNYKTAEKAANLFAPEKHHYSFDGYLYQLLKLSAALEKGISSKKALELVNSCLEISV